MCGRFSLFAPPAAVEERLDATFAEPFEPRYNAAPGQSLPVVTNEAPSTIRRLEWGLVPGWADDASDFGVINARAETVDEKPSFRDAYERRRCLVPADGFYEWADAGDAPVETDDRSSAGTAAGGEATARAPDDDGRRVPYRIAPEDGGVFAMAGIWERWEAPTRQTGLAEFGDESDDGGQTEVRETFAVLTTAADGVVGRLHDRMPVVVDPDEDDVWLDGDADERERVLRPYEGSMEIRRVSARVNDPSNDDPGVLEPGSA